MVDKKYEPWDLSIGWGEYKYPSLDGVYYNWEPLGNRKYAPINSSILTMYIYFSRNAVCKL